uniref:CUB and sushi domain-containing protein 3-like isoform X2 n=1 Tax=Crassostrea virginica TaxID=6565 RepID=A0A8B8D025_CRAVI|nr:CUB and sushi domain-containing protein 3-like isoform X2 [Crassostrea virginica]
MNCLVIFYLTITFTLSEQGTFAVKQTLLVDGTRNGSSGEITSPGYPGNYPNNANYTWILRTGHLKANVTFTILKFDIIKHNFTPCEDYLQITEKEPCCMLALKRCGQFNQFSLTVTGKEITVTFVTDISHNAKGFRLTWKVHLPELITTMMSTPIMTTILKTTTKTIPTTTLVTTTLPTTTLVTTTIPTTTLSTLRTTLMKRTSQPFTTSVNSPHVSLMLNNPSTKTTTQKEETSDILVDIEKTTVFTTHLTHTQITTQGHSITVQNNTTATSTEVYLILGISVAEFALIASGICIIKRRQKEPNKQTHRDIQVDKVRPISRKSVMSVANVYESIPLEHFSHDDIMEEDEEGGVYVDLPEHVYDRSFVKRTRANGNTNFYALITELKNKKA